MEKEKTLRDIFNLYLDKRKSEGKVITKESYQPIKSIVYFIENKKGKHYLTQKLFDEWYNDRIRPYGALTVVSAFLTYAKENGFLNIRCPKPIYVGKPRLRLFDMPLEQSIVSDMMSKFFKWREKTLPLNDSYHYTLIRFNNFCKDNYPEAKRLTQDMIDAWGEMKGNESAITRNRRLSPIALFIEYAKGNGWTNISKPSSLPEKPPVGRSGCHIFTKDELTKFFHVINSMKRHIGREPVRVYNRKCLVLSVLFRLMYSTGMRLVDVLRLKRGDVDLEKGTITFNGFNNKYKKTTIAMAESLSVLMRKYDIAMNKLIPDRKTFFPNDWDKSLTPSAINKHFRQIWTQVSERKACVSDFRVTFVVENINSWDYDGTEWTIDMVNLSKAIGLRNLRAMQKYLTLIPRYQSLLKELTGKNLEKLLPNINLFTDDEEESK